MEIFKLFGTILIKDEEALQRLNHVDEVAQNTSSKFSNMISNIGKIEGFEKFRCKRTSRNYMGASYESLFLFLLRILEIFHENIELINSTIYVFSIASFYNRKTGRFQSSGLNLYYSFFVAIHSPCFTGNSFHPETQRITGSLISTLSFLNRRIMVEPPYSKYPFSSLR